MVRGGAAAPPDDIDEPVVEEILDVPGHLLRRIVISSELVGQAGIGVNAGIEWRFVRHLFNEGPSSLAPKAQLKPMLNRSTCETELRNASTVWPESVLPLRSVIVPETMTGTFTPRFSRRSWMANRAALAFSVSKMVSTSSVSTPPSSKPWPAVIGVVEMVESDGPVSRVVHVRGEGSGFIGRAQCTGYETWL